MSLGTSSTNNTKRLSTVDVIKEDYPLHFLVWNNDVSSLREKLEHCQKEDIEKRDPRGRTPLILAVRLMHSDCVDLLINHNANVFAEINGWSVVQEAVSCGNGKILRTLLESRYQKQYDKNDGISNLLNKLKDTPDFYVEMKWEFYSSFIPPYFSRVLPNDICKIYKQGSNVRIDITLIGFDNGLCERGRRSLIFKGSDDYWTFMELDHNARCVTIESKPFVSGEKVLNQHSLDSEIQSRLSHPVFSTYIDVDKVNFERNKSGIWGWRQDKVEDIGGHSCKVYSANNVDVVTRTRQNAGQRHTKKSKAHFPELAAAALTNYNVLDQDDDVYNNISAEEYFTAGCDLAGRDIGPKLDEKTKVRRLKANLWLCENFPLNLQEQVMPILELIGSTNTHFRKLKEFIQLQLPAGFPVKIEIPLYQVINASVTFNNIFGLNTSVPGVIPLMANARMSCFIDDSVFELPAEYVVSEFYELSPQEEGAVSSYYGRQSQHLIDNEMQAFQDEQRIEEWAALNSETGGSVVNPIYEDQDLQKAIEESLQKNGVTAISDDITAPSTSVPALPLYQEQPTLIPEAQQLQTAILLSRKEQEEMERRLREEEEDLQKVLELSIAEK